MKLNPSGNAGCMYAIQWCIHSRPTSGYFSKFCANIFIKDSLNQLGICPHIIKAAFYCNVELIKWFYIHNKLGLVNYESHPDLCPNSFIKQWIVNLELPGFESGKMTVYYFKISYYLWVVDHLEQRCFNMSTSWRFKCLFQHTKMLILEVKFIIKTRKVVNIFVKIFTFKFWECQWPDFWSSWVSFFTELRRTCEVSRIFM